MPLPSSEAGFKKKKRDVYTTTSGTDKGKVKKLVKAIIKSFLADKQKDVVWILTGVSGTSDGEVAKERRYFWDEDKKLESQYIKAVDVHKFTKPGKISKQIWKKYLGKKGPKILAWANSEQSRTGWMKDAGLNV